MKLHRDLGITQKSAWFLAQRLRAALSADSKLFSGPVEVGNLPRQAEKHEQRRKELADTGRGPVRTGSRHQVPVIQSDAETLPSIMKPPSTMPDESGAHHGPADLPEAS